MIRERLSETMLDGQKYSQGEIANMVTKLSSNSEHLYEEPKQEENDVRLNVLEYIKKIEGFRIRLREIHWSTQKHSEHVLTDDLIKEFEEHEDSVAEVCMGVLGVRIKVGEVIPTLPEETTLKDLLVTALLAAVELKRNVETSPNFAGLVNLLDDFVQEISKGKYLETLA